MTSRFFFHPTCPGQGLRSDPLPADRYNACLKIARRVVIKIKRSLLIKSITFRSTRPEQKSRVDHFLLLLHARAVTETVKLEEIVLEIYAIWLANGYESLGRSTTLLVSRSRVVTENTIAESIDNLPTC